MRLLSLERFDALWREYHAAADPHERYRLRSLVVWHTPVPYKMRTFLDRKPTGSQP